MIMEIGFLAAFSFCMVILLLMLRYAAIHWCLKAALTVSSIIVVLMFHQGLVMSMGWPADLRPDCTMLIAGSDIREPGQDTPGIIYLWFVDVDAAMETHTAGTPRSIHMPYSKDTHEKLAQAAKNAASGIPSYMKFGASGLGGVPAQGSGMQGDPAARGAGQGLAGEGEINFVPPPSSLPKKAG